VAYKITPDNVFNADCSAELQFFCLNFVYCMIILFVDNLFFLLEQPVSEL